MLVISGLFKEIEEMLAGYVVDDKLKVGWSLESVMQRDDIRMGGERLMQMGLKHLNLEPLGA